MSSNVLHPNPEGIYLHSQAPDWLQVSVSSSIGPYFILSVSLCILAGGNLALYLLYLQHFGGRKGDRWYIQLMVFVSIAINVSFAVFSVQSFYVGNFITMYSPLGYDMNAMEPYVIPAHVLQAVPDAIGQTYFVLRIAKLFDGRRLRTRIATGITLVAVIVQCCLMIYFGVVFYDIKTKSRLAMDTALRSRIRRIIGVWATLFITIEFAMTATTISRLLILRKRSKMDYARKIIFNLAVYSLQGQIALTSISILTTYSFLKSTEGFYSPMYLCAGSCYTIVLVSNLLYRTTVAHEMREAQTSNNGAVEQKSGYCAHGCQFQPPSHQRQLSEYEPAPYLPSSCVDFHHVPLRSLTMGNEDRELSTSDERKAASPPRTMPYRIQTRDSSLSTDKYSGSAADAYRHGDQRWSP